MLSSDIYTSTAGEGRQGTAHRLEERVRYNLHADVPLLVLEPGKASRIRRRAEDLLGRIIFLRRADRLMALARRAILDSDAEGRTFPACRIWWAERLSRAKGRMDRHWQADPGGIYLCIATYPVLLPKRWQLYNIAAGVAVCEILREWGVKAEIRWLNDILLNAKKVAGILAETVSTPGTGERYLLTGLGLNVNQQGFPEHLRESSTSLSKETGRQWPLLELGSHILSRMAFHFASLHDWEAACLAEDFHGDGCSPVILAYRNLCNARGRKIRYGRDLEKSTGMPAVATEITPGGALKLVMEDGGEMEVSTGEIRYAD